MITSAAVHPCSAGEAMANWPTGMAVVTTADRDGWWWGFTSRSVSSVSSRPPMVAVSVERDAVYRPVFTSADAFAVHVLRTGQEELAERFSGGVGTDFEGVTVECGFEDVPLLADVVVRLECRQTEVVRTGQSLLLLGEVVRARTGAGEPLVHVGHGFRGLARPA